MTLPIDPAAPLLAIAGEDHHPDDLRHCLAAITRAAGLVGRLRNRPERPYAEDDQDRDMRIWRSGHETLTLVTHDMDWRLGDAITVMHEAVDMDEGFEATLREVPKEIAEAMMADPLAGAETIVALCLSACRHMLGGGADERALDALMAVEGAAWAATTRLSGTTYRDGIDHIVVAAPSPWSGAIVETFATPDSSARRMDTSLRELEPLSALPRIVEVHASRTGFALEVHAAVRSGDVMERMRAAAAYAALRRGDDR